MIDDAYKGRHQRSVEARRSGQVGATFSLLRSPVAVRRPSPGNFVPRPNVVPPPAQGYFPPAKYGQLYFVDWVWVQPGPDTTGVHWANTVEWHWRQEIIADKPMQSADRPTYVTGEPIESSWVVGIIADRMVVGGTPSALPPPIPYRYRRIYQFGGKWVVRQEYNNYEGLQDIPATFSE